MASKKPNLPSNGQRIAIIYCRVSTEDQRDNGLSLESQEKACLVYAAQQGWTVLRVVSEDFTGYKLQERPLFSQVCEIIHRGEANILLCYHADRMSRHQTHSLIIFDAICEAGAELWFVRHGQIEDSPMGRAMLSLFATGAAMERDNIIERTVRGKRQRLLSGKLHRAGCDLYGYTRNAEKTARIIKDDEARIVRLIFQWTVEETLGARSIAKRLNSIGVPPSSFGKKCYKDGRISKWGKSQVTRILTEPAYKGETVGWRWKSAGRHRAVIRRPEGEHIKLPEGTSPAIVTPELWEAAQKCIATNRGETTRNQKRQYLLRGHIFCSVCQRRMYCDLENGKTRIYRCSSRQQDAKPCGSKRVNASDVENWVWSKVKDIIIDPEIIEREVKRLEMEGPNEQLIIELEAATQRLRRIENGQEKLIRRFRESDEDEMIWSIVQREIEQAEGEKAQVKEFIVDMKSRLASYQQAKAGLESLKSYCKKVADELATFTFEDKRNALKGLRVRIMANGRAWRFDGKTPEASSDSEFQYQSVSVAAAASQQRPGVVAQIC